jgi:alpha-tubulin suppressor-like RCC1 family protein
VSVGGPVKDIALGEDHTCALLQTGEVRCWGRGIHGQLGYGNTQNLGDNDLPSSKGVVAVGGDVVQISAGDNHTCALLVNGFVRCWGLGSSGQLGYGNFNPIGDNELPTAPAAGDVSTGGKVLQVAAGGNHTCVLLATGDVKCWGYGANGQLGNGSSSNVHTPPASPVSLGGSSAMQIAAGTNHTCALLDSGNAWCWGLGTDGRLGYGNTTAIGDNELPTAGGDINILGP